MNPKVNWYFTENKKWQEQIETLRTIVLDCGLDEELKWGVPCYTFDKKNIVLIHVFKDYCALLFVQGALLKDPKEILIRQTENVQAARQVRFTSTAEILRLKKTLNTYIKNAIEIERSGIKVPLKKTTEFKMPVEFKKKLETNPGLKTAFKALTPGRQRGYLLFFSKAKQSKTRETRIERNISKILNGKGLDD